MRSICREVARLLGKNLTFKGPLVYDDSSDCQVEGLRTEDSLQASEVKVVVVGDPPRIV